MLTEAEKQEIEEAEKELTGSPEKAREFLEEYFPELGEVLGVGSVLPTVLSQVELPVGEWEAFIRGPLKEQVLGPLNGMYEDYVDYRLEFWAERIKRLRSEPFNLSEEAAVSLVTSMMGTVQNLWRSAKVKSK
jgi:hypothetical protein